MEKITTNIDLLLVKKNIQTRRDEYIETIYWNLISIKLILRFTDPKQFSVSKHFKIVSLEKSY